MASKYTEFLLKSVLEAINVLPIEYLKIDNLNAEGKTVKKIIDLIMDNLPEDFKSELIHGITDKLRTIIIYDANTNNEKTKNIITNLKFIIHDYEYPKR